MALEPTFLDYIYGVQDSFIGFGGGIIVLIIFFIVNRRYLSFGGGLGLGILIYFASLATGAAYSGQRDGAFVAGFWAPIFYCILAGIWLHYNYQPPKEEKSDIDHLIH